MASLDLIKFSREGNIDKVRELIKNGALVNIKDNNKFTSLDWVSAYGHLEVVQLLLQHGAASTPVLEINNKNEYGNTPLHFASSNGHLEIVQLLLQHGAASTPVLEINIQNKNGNTPLHWASNNGHPEIVQLLLDNGAEVNIQNKNGDTPLHDASRNGHTEIVKVLLRNAANKNIKDVNGKYSSDVAKTQEIRNFIDNWSTVEASNNTCNYLINLYNKKIQDIINHILK